MIAPKKFLAVALLAITDVEATATCAYPTAGVNPAANATAYKSWFATLAKIAQDSFVGSTTIDATTFPGTLLTGADAALITAASVPDCEALLITLVNDMKSQLNWLSTQPSTALPYNCPTTAWNAGSHPALWSNYQCTRMMVEATSKFNTGAGNGYDIVTGEPNRRCTISQYTDIEMKFMPYFKIVQLAALQNGGVPSYGTARQMGSLIYSLIEPTSDTLYESLIGLPTLTANGVSGTCGECFYNFYKSVLDEFNLTPATFTACTGISGGDDDACRTGLKVQISKFIDCIGSNNVHFQEGLVSNHCSDLSWNMFDNTYRAYGAIGRCNGKTGNDLEKCLIGKSGIPIGDGGGMDKPECLNCWSKLSSDIYALSSSSCASDPFSSGCMSKINGFSNMSILDLIKNGMKSPLTEFAVCTGYRMNVVSPVCSSTEIAAIKSSAGLNSSQIMGVMLSSAMESGITAHQLIDSYMQLPYNISSVSCAPAFSAMAIDFHSHRNVLGLACTTPPACVKMLNTYGILDAFKAHTGFALTDLDQSASVPSDSGSTTDPPSDGPIDDDVPTDDDTSSNSVQSVTMSLALVLIAIASQIN